MAVEEQTKPSSIVDTSEAPMSFPATRTLEEQGIVKRLQSRTQVGYLLSSLVGLGSFYLFGGFRFLFAPLILLFPCFYPVVWISGLYWIMQDEKKWRCKLINDAAWEIRRVRSAAGEPAAVEGFESPSLASGAARVLGAGDSTAVESVTPITMEHGYEALSEALDRYPSSQQLASEMRRLAESGCARACFDVGASLDLGEESVRDGIQAAEWFMRAADLGNSAARALIVEGLLMGSLRLPGLPRHPLRLIGYLTEDEASRQWMDSTVIQASIGRAVKAELARASSPLQIVARYVPLEDLDLSLFVEAIAVPANSIDSVFSKIMREGILPIRCEGLGALLAASAPAPGQHVTLLPAGPLKAEAFASMRLRLVAVTGASSSLEGVAMLIGLSGSTTKQIPDRRRKTGYREEEETYSYSGDMVFRMYANPRATRRSNLVENLSERAGRLARAARFQIPTRFSRNEAGNPQSHFSTKGALGIRYRSL